MEALFPPYLMNLQLCYIAGTVYLFISLRTNFSGKQMLQIIIAANIHSLLIEKRWKLFIGKHTSYLSLDILAHNRPHFGVDDVSTLTKWADNSSSLDMPIYIAMNVSACTLSQ